MKKLLTILLNLFVTSAIGQFQTYPFDTTESKLQFGNGWFSDYDVHSKYDTLLLFNGIDTVIHEHSYVTKRIGGIFSYSSCAVLHGAEGCPDSWLNADVICTICLRNFTIKESRVAVKRIDLYSEAKKRLELIQKK